MQQKRAGIQIYLIFIVGLIFGSLYSPLQRAALAADPALNSMTLPFIRLLITAGIMLAVCASKKKYRQELRFIFADKKILLALIGMGVARGAEIMFWSLALEDNSTFIVNIVGNLAPVFIIIFSYIIFKVRTPMKALLGVIACITGVVIIGFGGSTDGSATLAGVAMMVTSSCFGAIFIMISTRIRKHCTAAPMLATVFAFSTLTIFFMNIAVGTEFVAISPSGWYHAALLAISCTLVAQGVTVYTTKFMEATTVSVMQLMGPIFAAISAYIILGEKITGAVVLGGAVMLFGLGYYIISSERLKVRQPYTETIDEDEITEQEDITAFGSE